MSSDVQDIQNLRRRLSLTFGSATSITSAIDLMGYRLAAIDWNANASANVALTFQGSQDNSTFYNLYDSSGTELTIASGAFSTATPRSVLLDPTLSLNLTAHRWLKIRTGTAGSAISSWSTAFTFDVVLMPA